MNDPPKNTTEPPKRETLSNMGMGHMEGNAKEENQPSKKDDLPADIFSSVLEVLEVLGIANYSILIRVSSVFTFKSVVLVRARTVLGGARNWVQSGFNPSFWRDSTILRASPHAFLRILGCFWGEKIYGHY